MVNPTQGKPKAKRVAKTAAAKAPPPAAIKAEASAAKPVASAPVAKAALPPAAKAAPAPIAKPAPAPVAKAAPVTAAPAKTVVAAKPAPVAPPPAKAEAPAKIETPAKIADTLPKVAEAVVEAASKPVEKAAAIPVAVAEALTPTPAAKSVKKGFLTMTETITPKSFVPTPESFQAILGDMSTRAKAVMENSAKMAEEMGDFAKGNVEALMTSSRVAAKGAETLGQEAAAYSKKSLETATSAFKGFAAAKSPSELFKLQSDYARTSFDAAVAEGSKFSEAMMKLFGEITQPISTRVAMAAEKIKTPAF